jgi:phosphoglucosamine mutase
MGRLFGTDGVRGVAFEELSLELVEKLGRAASLEFSGGKKLTVIGCDTRLSGPELEKALSEGFMSNGWNVISIGIIPTPGLARICKEKGLFGVMISASHNPIEYNGIKFFSPEGQKLRDEEEDKIESLLNSPSNGTPKGKFIKDDTFWSVYIDELASYANVNLKGKKIVLDCAYGATYKCAPELFKKIGAEVIALHAEANGGKINVECGSTNTDIMQKTVISEKAYVGFAFDGDGDRCIACDEKGNIVDGDKMMGILANFMKSKNRLPGDLVINTVMTNMGLEEFLGKHGITMQRTKVGDRYVHQRMIETGSNLGGEQSGHLIIADRTTTGDGTLSALCLMEALSDTPKKLSELAEEIPTYPQILINVKVKDKEHAMKSPLIKELETEAEKIFSGRGRILIRPSGTEPLVRVMVEAFDKHLCDKTAHDAADRIRKKFCC